MRVHFHYLSAWVVLHVDDLDSGHPVEGREPQELLLFGPGEEEKLSILGLQRK